MKNLVLSMIILLSLCACCHKEAPVPLGYVKHRVALKNDLGELMISLPQEFDTTYSWTNFSDYYCGDTEMFRIANKNYSLLQETGIFYSTPDSLCQMTIGQLSHKECNDSVVIDASFMDMMVERYKQIYTITDSGGNFAEIKIFARELRKIDGRSFVIIGSEIRRKIKLVKKIEDRGAAAIILYLI
ncbi:hypothetical protein LJC68_01745 [Bacteroidales bacterium OttesenSCG-928-B11]|nr:hypothetical protein [Bacteroidales bacterium OttesenSCG-928-C03]MDL2311587.1 hypothetical protein [Bacteroidales bacterium OttesenSCG-928-B11]